MTNKQTKIRSNIPPQTMKIGLFTEPHLLPDILAHKGKDFHFLLIPSEWALKTTETHTLKEIKNQYELHLYTEPPASSRFSVEKYFEKLGALQQRLELDAIYIQLNLFLNAIEYKNLPWFAPESLGKIIEQLNRWKLCFSCPLILENSVFYSKIPMKQTEWESITSILQHTALSLHLNLTALKINSINHDYLCGELLKKVLPTLPIHSLSVSGQFVGDTDLIFDETGEDMRDSAWILLSRAYQELGILPTVLHRTISIPPFSFLLSEINYIKELQFKAHLWHRMKRQSSYLS